MVWRCRLALILSPLERQRCQLRCVEAHALPDRAASRLGARRPHAHTNPRARAGLPKTRTWSGTSRVTTLPAPTIAQRPIVTPATIVLFAPIEAPARINVGVETQSAAPRRTSSGVTA